MQWILIVVKIERKTSVHGSLEERLSGDTYNVRQDFLDPRASKSEAEQNYTTS